MKITTHDSHNSSSVLNIFEIDKIVWICDSYLPCTVEQYLDN